MPFFINAVLDTSKILFTIDRQDVPETSRELLFKIGVNIFKREEEALSLCIPGAQEKSLTLLSLEYWVYLCLLSLLSSPSTSKSKKLENGKELKRDSPDRSRRF